MLSNALVAHGIALDTARIKGVSVVLWRLRREDAIDLYVDTGMAVGLQGLSELPDGGVVYARYVPHEAVKHMIRMSMAIPWLDVALHAAIQDSREHDEPQALWELADGAGYFNCHPSIKLDSAHKRLRVLYVT
jgi:hypothetical protein